MSSFRIRVHRALRTIEPAILDRRDRGGLMWCARLGLWGLHGCPPFRFYVCFVR
uniref:Uncharacterized protein n=1 Tax=Hyaloperonospora arabidopsidis (strain Emoy2) TaxID=559515 RepID=M4B3F5_HYAAE